MSKLDKLTCHIINCGYVNAESVTSIQNSIEITATGRPIASSENVIIFEKSYLANITIVGFPHQRISENDLFAQISSWLLANDANSIGQNKFNIFVNTANDETAEIEIELYFKEYIIGVSDINGNIMINNNKFSL